MMCARPQVRMENDRNIPPNPPILPSAKPKGLKTMEKAAAIKREVAGSIALWRERGR
jgi:hypothetical protein